MAKIVTHTCTHIKRSVTSRNRTPMGSGMSTPVGVLICTPYGGAYAHGGPKGLPCAPGPKVPVKKKKKKNLTVITILAKIN